MIRLEFDNGYVLDDNDVFVDMELTQSVNPDGDFLIGVSSSAQLKFSVNDLYAVIPNEAIDDHAFALKRGRVTAINDLTALYNRFRKQWLIRDDSAVYMLDNRQPYVSVLWDDGEIYNPVQPVAPVVTGYVEDDILYCLHDVEPYVTAYAIGYDRLVMVGIPLLTDHQKHKQQWYRDHGICFIRTNDTTRQYNKRLYHSTVEEYSESTVQYQQRGIFTCEKPTRKNDNVISVLAYDNMTRFNVIVDEWNDTLSYPMTAEDMLHSLCEYCGIGVEYYPYTNGTFKIKRRYRGTNVTGRQVLQWIAQLMAGFAAINEEGHLYIQWYCDSDYAIDERQYTSVKVAEYETAPIDKLQIQATENDIGVIVGDGNNTYIIQNNPLLYADSDAQLRPAAMDIFNAIKSFTYTPYSIRVLGARDSVGAGHTATVTTRKGQTFRAVIMSCTLRGVNALTAEYSATGNRVRETQKDAVNYALQVLNRRTNEIVATVEEFSATLTEIDEQVGINTAQLLIQADQIVQKVSYTDYNGNTIASMINQKATTISIIAEKLDLTGYVTISALSGSGTTIINGDNIQAGKIKAQYLELQDADIYGTFTSGYQSLGDHWVKMANGYYEVWYWPPGYVSTLIGTLRGNPARLSLELSSTRDLDLKAVRNVEILLSQATSVMTVRNSSGNQIFSVNPQQSTTYGNISITSVFGMLSVSTGIEVFRNLNVYNGNLSVINGSKSCVVETAHQGARVINAYETAEYYFGDIGTGELVDGVCVVPIEDTFRECVNTDVDYQVFVSAYDEISSALWVSNKTPHSFTVNGTSDAPFCYEIKAKRRNYELTRLTQVNIPQSDARPMRMMAAEPDNQPQNKQLIDFADWR